MALTTEFPAGTKVRATPMNASSIPVVSATSDITSPFTGQTVFNTTDYMIYLYDGSAWTAVLASGGNTSARRHQARYEAVHSQSVTTGTDTKLQFPTAVTTTDDVTASGSNNTDFLLNRSGWWLVTASIRYAAATGGERNLNLSSGTNVATLANRFAVQSTFPGTAGGPVGVTAAKYFASGTSIFAATFQNNGSSVLVDNTFGSTNHISLTWLRPL